MMIDFNRFIISDRIDLKKIYEYYTINWHLEIFNTKNGIQTILNEETKSLPRPFNWYPIEIPYDLQGKLELSNNKLTSIIEWSNSVYGDMQDTEGSCVISCPFGDSRATTVAAVIFANILREEKNPCLRAVYTVKLLRPSAVIDLEFLEKAEVFLKLKPTGIGADLEMLHRCLTEF